ncbi:MAG: hypothetical protein SGI86_23140, partial [Deltaproteobacteria bacterium]|nr:hypothetical protein [Deltaproteobacteria bacterium]
MLTNVSAVIVIYKHRIAESEAFKTLTLALERAEIPPNGFELTIWDNSPDRQDPPNWPYPIRYEHDPRNG